METAIDQPDEGNASRERLLERARTGDRDAFETLYRLHHRQVHALSLRLTCESRRADELTQEVFVRAWRSLHGFRGESRLGTWLHTITVRAHSEHENRERRIGGREISGEAVDSYAFAARRAMPGTRIDLERAIAKLPKGAREVLVLHDIYGYKHREIATMLDVAEGTTKAQLHRARKLARSFLEPKGGESSAATTQTERT